VTREERIQRLERARLYFVCQGRPRDESPDDLLAAALRGGADLIQLRDKATRTEDELVALSQPFRRAADAHGALFILNDRPDLVEACHADGVHVGQDDIPVADAREAAGAAALVGLSTHTPGQIDAACRADGAARPDQISVGPVWETPTKEGRPAAGLELIRYAAAHATIPWFAIGGIDSQNVREVVDAGAMRVVVVRAIRDADDPEEVARSLCAALPDGTG
jgi:thiamine-phosphate pyrophosphorylase